MKIMPQAAGIGCALLVVLGAIGCSRSGTNAGTAGGANSNLRMSSNSDAQLRKGMQNYPKTVNEVPPQYRQMVLDAEKMKAQKRAPTAPANVTKK